MSQENVEVGEPVRRSGPRSTSAERWLEAWDTFVGEAEEVESAPAEDRAFVALRFRGRGKGSGIEIEDRLFWVAEVRGGRLYRISEYSDRAEALEAAGLSE